MQGFIERVIDTYPPRNLPKIYPKFILTSKPVLSILCMKCGHKTQQPFLETVPNRQLYIGELLDGP